MKICSKCGMEKDESAFRKSRYGKEGLRAGCKDCEKLSYKEYYKRNKEKLSKKNKKYREEHKEEISKRQKEYYIENKEKIAERDKIKYNKNKDKILVRSKKWKEDNKDKRKKYLIKNKKRIQKQMAEYRNNNKHVRKAYTYGSANFSTYSNQLTVDEAPRLAKDGLSLEVKCRYCGKYFIPTVLQVSTRIRSLSGKNRGDCFIYCSEYCKNACPIYRKIKYPKSFKKASSREVDPLVRQLTFERDDWECQKCGATQVETQLHAHHIKPYTQNKILGNDVDNCITLCKHCHKKVHAQDGCRYHELKCQ